MAQELTLGQYRVGISFNPSNNTEVDEVKQLAATFIDKLEPLKANGPEVARLAAHAQTLIEDAAMNAVKAITKQPRY
jgi:hypothetical protein